MITQIDTFKLVTGYDIGSFFQNFSNFVTNKYQLIVDYYDGLREIDQDVHRELNDLIEESEIIYEIVQINVDQLSKDVGFWVILEDFENCYVRLQTIKKAYKWQRASYSVDYDNKADLDFTFNSKETIERAARSIGYPNEQDNWVEIALKNSLKEVDYDLNGGGYYQVSFFTDINVKTQSVVDLMVGERIIGKDIDKAFSFDGDDIVYLEPSDTLDQSVGVLLELQKNQNPEFPNHGAYSFVGSNINTFNLPILLRQVIENFRRDDSIDEVEMLDVERDQDTMNIKFRIVSKKNKIELVKTLSV